MHFVWTHIGTWSDQASRYVGTFDGQNHTISGLYVNTTSSGSGLFGGLDSSGTVKNVTIVNACFNGAGRIGSIVGNNTGGCIENCSNSGVQTIQYYIADETVTDFTNILWETYDATNKISLNTTGKYVIYVRITDKAGNTTIEGLSTDGVVVYKENTVTSEVSREYKAGKPLDITGDFQGNTIKSVTCNDVDLVYGTDYDVAYADASSAQDLITLNESWLDNLDAGEYTLTIAFYPQGIETNTVDVTQTVKLMVEKAPLTITSVTASDKDYDGTNQVAVSDVRIIDIKETDTVSVDVTNVTGMVSSANAGSYNTVILGVLDAEGILTGADAENYQINVPSEEVSLSSPVTINKASIEVDDHTVVKRYVYTVDTTESIDVKAFLPEDCGGIAVSQPEVSGDFTLTEDGVVFENGTLTYTICKGEIGETGTIKVKLISQNYSTVCVTLDVVLVDNYG